MTGTRQNRQNKRRAIYSQPNDVYLARGNAFAAWHKQARLLKGWSIPDLARAIEYSDTLVRILDEDGGRGIDSNGAYRPPGWDYISSVATVSGADYRAGLVAAGIIEDLGLTKDLPVELASGDLLRVARSDPNPEDTAAAVEAFLTVYRARRDAK